MSVQDQARALMHQHHHLVKNRQQAMLGRVSVEVGLRGEMQWNHIQGKPLSTFSDTYDRSAASLS